VADYRRYADFPVAIRPRNVTWCEWPTIRSVATVNTSPSHRSNRVRATRTTMPFSLLALVPGTRIGVYDITTQIGAGGMGEAGKLTSGGL
jgi:hypothetical protein